MKKESYEGCEIDVCSQCQGTWLDADELLKIAETEEVTFSPQQAKATIKETMNDKKERQEVMRHVLKVNEDAGVDETNVDSILEAFHKRWGKPRQINCPKCDKAMEEFEYASTGIMLDRCLEGHGFWLDNGELDKMQMMMEYYKRLHEPAPKTDAKLTWRKCPVCTNEKLVEKSYEGVPLDFCLKCGGVWLDSDELHQVIEKKEEKFSQGVKEEVNPEEFKQAERPSLVKELNCPICGSLMNRLVYVSFSGIIIDRCSQGHGVWLDKGELDKVQVYAEESEELGEANRDKYAAIAQQAKADFEQWHEDMIQNIKVSRFGCVNKLMRWMARKWD